MEWTPADDVVVAKPLTSEEKRLIKAELRFVRGTVKHQEKRLEAARRRTAAADKQLAEVTRLLESNGTTSEQTSKRLRGEEPSSNENSFKRSRDDGDTPAANRPQPKLVARNTGAFGFLQGALKSVVKQKEDTKELDLRRRRAEIENREKLEQLRRDKADLARQIDALRRDQDDVELDYSRAEKRYDVVASIGDNVEVREDAYCAAFFLFATNDDQSADLIARTAIPFLPAVHTDFSRTALLERVLPVIEDYQSSRDKVEVLLAQLQTKLRQREEKLAQQRAARQQRQQQHQQQQQRDEESHGDDAPRSPSDDGSDLVVA